MLRRSLVPLLLWPHAHLVYAEVLLSAVALLRHVQIPIEELIVEDPVNAVQVEGDFEIGGSFFLVDELVQISELDDEDALVISVDVEHHGFDLDVALD